MSNQPIDFLSICMQRLWVSTLGVAVCLFHQLKKLSVISRLYDILRRFTPLLGIRIAACAV